MRYVVAGYVIALAVLFMYSASLVLRRRRLERAARLIPVEEQLGDNRHPPSS